ncbi:hypothetical protein CG723_41070 [Streptomyces sp. CB01635]|uniref:hypothetical protein n=1 Tax=unclassified Streptomyces TaxID=2593676 RepID=UPI000C272EA3|nr:hypothetical protein [Streptomyces sp. CB01635]PJN06135.1 hypothetical protein CG723_41070 [Streptomyces sp. CB01635]
MLVSWTTLEATQTENVVAVMLCREHPRAVRIRPSQGDGGIDVVEVTEDGWVVYQIKYFANNLEAGQKSQIADSYRKVQAYAASRGARIAAWHLVLPLDATKENRFDWFRTLTQDAGYPCEWMGLTHLNGLAAKYQDVIDYFIGNGKEQLVTLLRQLHDFMGLQRSADRALNEGEPVPLAAVDVTNSLESLYRALNAHDPFYRYSFSVDQDRTMPQNEPTLVFASQTQDGDGPCITFRVYARYDQAVHDHELGIKWVVSFSEDKPAPQAFHEALTYGTPMTVTSAETASFNCILDLPGGLGGQFSNGTIRLGPAWQEEAPDRKLRLQLLNEAGQILESLTFEMEPTRRGLSGKGLSAFGRDASGILEVQTLTSLEGKRPTTMRFSRNPLEGLPPDEVLPALRFMARLKTPHSIRAAAPYGPVRSEPMPFQGDPNSDMHVMAARAAAVAEALSVVQEHTTEQLVMPDLLQTTFVEAARLQWIARLLRHETFTYQWDRAEMALPKETSPVPVTQGDVPEQRTFYLPLTITLAGQDRELGLGMERIDFPSALVEAAEGEDGWRLSCRPGDSTEGTSTHVPGAGPDGARPA